MGDAVHNLSVICTMVRKGTSGDKSVRELCPVSEGVDKGFRGIWKHRMKYGKGH